MAAAGTQQKKMPYKPTQTQYYALVGYLAVFSVVGGYFAGVQPIGQWRFFSWHPFLMTVGMVGLAGASAVTKKMGGYVNTKTHGILASLATIVSVAGMYVIYRNKENNGFYHLRSTHSQVGAFLGLAMIGLGAVGGVVLHPDFGVDKGNKTIRLAHKLSSRIVLFLAWVTAVVGLYSLTKGKTTLALYAMPLLALAPFTLV